MSGVRKVFAMALFGAATAAVGACGRRAEETAPAPAGPAAAAPRAADSLARAPGGAPSAPAKAPASPPVAQWQDPRVVAGLVERCDFDPHKLEPADQARRFGHALEEEETISCAGAPPAQSCAFDPCLRAGGRAACEKGCEGSCDRCAAGCVSACGGCKTRCAGDAACERRCAEAAAACRQGCLGRRDSCVSADCAEAEKKCNERFIAAWVKHNCTDRVGDVYAPCAERCREADGGGTARCLARCRAKVSPCETDVYEMGDWHAYARYSPGWKKNDCDAKCATFLACERECEAAKSQACRDRCAEAADPCQPVACSAGRRG